MSDTFFAYLRKERGRLDDALANARVAPQADEAEIASLRQQRSIVDDQLARWTQDLSQDLVAV